jgi:exopolysaccharide biosynthesis protein
MLAASGAAAATVAPVLAPPAPFPTVLAASAQRETLAPGVALETYRLKTAAGPLVVSVILVDPKHPALHLQTVLAHDTIESRDELVSSMARRTHAVAGINGDYFDINASGAPLGTLVTGGALLRSPGGRAALTIADDGTVHFDRYTFSGTLTSENGSLSLGGINVWPPQAGGALLTPAFGTPPPGAGITVLSLSPLPDVPAAGRVRVDTVTPMPPFPSNGLRLAFASQAMPAFAAGDTLTISYDTSPSLANVQAALGGGPLLLQSGIPVDDSTSPNYAERLRRIPAAAAARLADGTLALVVVDGRRPATSIGVSRPEFAALLLGLGATDAMLFDSGGSATLVARAPGDVDATLVNDPSDGVERPVADGLFVYSDAPLGPPARLVVRPEAIVALAGARVPLQARIVDASEHPLGEARGPWTVSAPAGTATIDDADVLHVGTQLGAHTIRLTRGGVTTTLPLDIVPDVARLVLGPPRSNPEPHATSSLNVQGFDERDRLVAIAGLVRWSARGGTIDANGRLTTADRDAIVTASAGDAHVTVVIPVGRRRVPLALNAPGRAWKLVTVPAGGPGSVNVDEHGLTLAYDFSAGERGAFAIADLALGAPLSLSCAVDGDGNAEALRATLIDRYGEYATVTFARAVTFRDTRRLDVAISPELAPPIVLHAVYAVGTLANPPVTAAGSLGVHDCALMVPGTQTPAG